MPRWLRLRAPYFALAVGAVALGLTVHLSGVLSLRVRDPLGDAVWSAMVLWWAAAAAPAMKPPLRAAIALAFSYAVEFSQLYHTPALDTLRSTTMGHLVLGSGFDPRDLAAYAAGVLAAVVFDVVIVRPRSEGLTDPRAL